MSSTRVATRLRDVVASMRGLSVGSGATTGVTSLGTTAAAGAAHSIRTPSTQMVPNLATWHARAFAHESRWAAKSDAGTGSGPSSPEEATAGRTEKIQLPPWTPTRLLHKRKTLPKRMGHMLSVLEKEMEEEVRASRSFPDFRPGDHIELKLSIPQNKGRETVFKGICIAKRNRGWRTSFTLRNFIGNNGGIERSFPLYSPHIKDLKVLRQGKARRAKLYYLRNVQPKVYRI